MELYMTKELIFEDEYFSLWYHQETKIIHHKFHKYVFGQPFRDCLIKGLEQLQKTNAQKWLSDDRNNSALSPEDAKWAEEFWAPKTRESGWKHWAVVLPEAVVGKLNIKQFVRSNAENGINVKAFTDSDSAIEWLGEQ
jgi:hypothetical protein